MNLRALYAVAGVGTAAIAAIELFFNRVPDGTLLVIMTYWSMVIQGCVALVAAGILTKGIWLVPVRRDLLAVHPLLLMMAIMFLVFGVKMEIYPWAAQDHLWLSKNFFMIRNAVVLFLMWAVARPMSAAIMAGNDARRSKLAVLYMLLFVTAQSLIAFDWIMSLEYPWINTLLGPFIFVQSFMQGLIVTVFIIYFRNRAGEGLLTQTLTDTGKMIFGFSFMWGGFLFTQYLVIWYGNIPEEVLPLLERVSPSPYYGLSRVVAAMLFFLPFLTLLSRKVKFFSGWMSVIGLMILAGHLIEILILVIPVVPVNPLYLVIEFVIMALVTGLWLRNRNSFMPIESPEPLLEGKAAPSTAH